MKITKLQHAIVNMRAATESYKSWLQINIDYESGKILKDVGRENVIRRQLIAARARGYEAIEEVEFQLYMTKTMKIGGDAYNAWQARFGSAA